MHPILYKSDLSPPARAVMMLADILGLRMDQRNLNPVLREQDTSEYTLKNPMRTIPILDEGDFCLADSHAINIYLIEKYGKPENFHLYSSDKRVRAKINERLFFDCGVLFPRLRSVMAPIFAGKLTHLSTNMVTNIEDSYRTLEAYLSECKYMASDVMTVADVNTVATISTLHGLHPINTTRYPKLCNWFLTMSEKEFYKKINKPGNDQFVATLKGLMNINADNQKSKL